MMRELLFVFVGGGLGSVLRYCMGLFSHRFWGAFDFPVATFVVNIVGCFLIGLLYSLSERFCFSSETRLLFTVGLCGGFTTFSTFCYESLSLLRQGLYFTFGAYIALSVCLGILAAMLGASLLR